MATIRWGIIGCGDVTEVKSGPALYKTRDSELVAVMRRDADKAHDYTVRHGVPKWYDQADALIGDPDVDAVYIATPRTPTLTIPPKSPALVNLFTSKSQWRATTASAWQ